MRQYRVLHLAPNGRLDWHFFMAETEEEAAVLAIGRGWTPLEIRTGNPSLLERLNQPLKWGWGVNQADLMLLTDQLAALLEAGLPLDRCLDLLQTQTASRGSRALLQSLLARIRGGASLAGACADSRGVPRFYIGVLRAAERSGRLAEGLRDLSVVLRHAQRTRQQALSALTYPAIVLVMTITALGIVLVGVVPSFDSVFAGEAARLPLLTRSVIGLSRLITEHGVVLTMLGAMVLGFFLFVIKSGAAQQHLRPIIDRMPGALLYQTYTAGRICRALATMIANGVPLQDALPLAGDVVASRNGKVALDKVSRRLREGASLSSTLLREGTFPMTAVRLIEVGEQTGKLADLCSKAADLLEEDARVRLERVVSILNPLAILVLGGLIAALILGVMLGIFSLNDMAF